MLRVDPLIMGPLIMANSDHISAQMYLVADQQFQYAPNLTLRGLDQLLVEWESRSREDE